MDVAVKFRIGQILEEDHEVGIRAVVEDFEERKIGFIEMSQFNFLRASMDGYSWLSLIDEVDDDTLRLFEPLVATSDKFSDEFQDILDEHLIEVTSVIVIRRIFIKKRFRGNKLFSKIISTIRNLNYCPIVLSPVPLQHTTGEKNKKLMGYQGKKSDAKKDYNKLRKYYESLGFERVGKSETWVLI